MAGKVRKHIYFSGRVQGVGFRYRAAFSARALKLTGWVKNLTDGRVEMEVQGKEYLIWQFLKRLQNEKYIVITHVDITERPVRDDEVQFSVSGW